MIKRRFLLGEEWLYFKIYCGVRTADTILEELVATLTQALLEEKAITSWFFIRYGDPDPHIRLRLKISDKSELGLIIDSFNKLVVPYLEDQLIWNVQTDSYVREIERYGSNTMEICEDLFFYDSEFVLRVLNLIKDEELYFLYQLKGIDMFVDLFDLNEKEKLGFYQEGSLSYKNEFGVGKATKTSLDKKYRASMPKFSAIMNHSNGLTETNTIMSTLNRKNVLMNPLVKDILKENKSRSLEVPLSNLMASLVHMNVNRAFRDQQRFFELMAYDFLARYQNSKIKRLKKTTT